MRFPAVLTAFLVIASAAHAQETLAGRTITILVGFGAGQSPDLSSNNESSETAGARLTSEPTYDQAARFYATHLPRFLPGNPAVEFKLVPGAASLIAARQLERAPRGAIALGLLGPAAIFAPLTGAGGGFDPRSITWVGARQRDDDVCFARTGAAVQTAEDIKRTPAFVAALTPGSKSWIYARALNAFAGAKLKLISGYASAFEVSRALETAEVDVWCGWSIGAIRLRHQDLLSDGKIKLLVQFSGTEAGKGLSIARASDLASEPDARAAMQVLESQTRFGAFALATSARLEPALLAQLREGFLSMLRDPEVLADAARQGLEVDPVPGAELQEEADSALAISAGARALLQGVLRGP